MGWYFPLGVGQGAGGGNGTRRKLHIFIEISGKQNFLGFFFALFCNQQRKAPCTLRRDAEMIFLSAGPANRRKGESENGEDQKET